MIAAIMAEEKRALAASLPFAMDPVVYDFRINENGTSADLLSGRAALMPKGYYLLQAPQLLRRDPHYFLPTTGDRYLLFGSDQAAMRAQFLSFFSEADWRPNEALQRARAVLAGDPSPLDASVARQAIGTVLREYGDIDAAIGELRIARRLNARTRVVGSVENLFDRQYSVSRTPSLVRVGGPRFLEGGVQYAW